MCAIVLIFYQMNASRREGLIDDVMDGFLKTSPELSSYEDQTLYSTWQLSFDHAKQRNGLPAKLFSFGHTLIIKISRSSFGMAIQRGVET